MEKNYPYLITRIQSALIDILFIVLMMYGLARIFNNFENVPDWVKAVSFIGLWALYEPLAVTFGCTIGQFLMKLRVKQFGNSDKHINFFQSLIRYILKTFLGWLSFVTINSNPEKRAIHDMMVGSIMLKV